MVKRLKRGYMGDVLPMHSTRKALKEYNHGVRSDMPHVPLPVDILFYVSLALGYLSGKK